MKKSTEADLGMFCHLLGVAAWWAIDQHLFTNILDVTWHVFQGQKDVWVPVFFFFFSCAVFDLQMIWHETIVWESLP